MILVRHKNFKRHYKSRISQNKKLTKKFEERLVLFLKNPNDPFLKDHQLTGKMVKYRSFWIGGDTRVVYRIEGEKLELYDVGSHNQVY